MDTDFPGNSRNIGNQPEKKVPPISTPSDNEPKLESVVSGKVIRRKKPVSRRLMENFFGGDGVVAYLGKEVLLPALQNLVTDFVKQGIDRAVYGDSAPRSTRGSSAQRTHVSYDRPSTIVNRPSTTTPAQRRPVTQPSAFDIGDIIVEDRITADTIAEQMYDTCEKYGAATVANLNDLLGQTSAYTDHKWGWTNLDGLTIRRVREGYLLQLSAPEDLR